MKALFLCKGELRYFYPVVAAELKRATGWDVEAVTFNTPSVAFVARSGVFAVVHNLAAHLKAHFAGHGLAACVAALERLEAEPDVPPLAQLIYSDRILSLYPYQ